VPSIAPAYIVTVAVFSKSTLCDGICVIGQAYVVIVFAVDQASIVIFC
jgi:hypothetical protein